MSDTPKIIVKDKYYVPMKFVHPDKLKSLYVIDVFDEKMCGKCEYKPERPCETCETCKGFTGRYKLYNEREVAGTTYIGLPTGNKKKLKRVLTKPKSKFKIKDKRTSKKFKTKGLKFTAKLWKYQKKAIAKLAAKGYGVLKSAPRTGKTVMATALCIKLGYKTLILAHQDDLIKQFLEHFENEGFDCTNIPDIEKFNGEKIVGICTKVSDFKKYDICLATYQTFLSENGGKKLQEVRDLFGTLIVDEVHRGNADGYSKVINQFSARHKFGLSATPQRKDGKEFIVRDIIGPITHKTKASPMKPICKVVNTGVAPNRNYKIWTHAMRFLEREEKRNKLIVKHAVMDIKKGYNIIIPVTFKSHAETLTKMINEAIGNKVAIEFTGAVSKKNRRKLLLEARKAKKIRCVVAMRSMLTGVNVPAWSMIYEVIPINNPPNFEQEVFRVCTEVPGKKQPVIKFFIDDFNISRACFRGCVNTITEMRKQYGGFRWTDASYKRMRKHLDAYYRSLKFKRQDASEGRRPKYNDDEEFAVSRASHSKLLF